jgi:hypothetical protein
MPPFEPPTEYATSQLKSSWSAHQAKTPQKGMICPGEEDKTGDDEAKRTEDGRNRGKSGQRRLDRCSEKLAFPRVITKLYNINIPLIKTTIERHCVAS